MSVSKVSFGGNTLIDLTYDTVTASDLLSGKTAHDSSGAIITGTIPSISAATITPSTTNQTIAAGNYLSGIQTISGDANLIASNIKSGVSIFGVTGAYPVIGTITPTESRQIQTINHGLSTVSGFCIYPPSGTTFASGILSVAGSLSAHYGVYLNSSSDEYLFTESLNAVFESATGVLTIGVETTGSSRYYLKEEITYNYIVW